MAGFVHVSKSLTDFFEFIPIFPSPRNIFPTLLILGVTPNSRRFDAWIGGS